VGSGFDLQLHDFNPGITPNGVFWIVSVPDDAIEIHGNSLTIRFKDVAVVDQLQFPTGTGTAPVLVTNFEATYTSHTDKATDSPRRVRPTSPDPLSPFHWAGKMWDATNTGNFSVMYKDSSFSASGTFSSEGQFGEMGTERNGSFLKEEEDEDNDGPEVDFSPSGQGQTSAPAWNQVIPNQSTAPRNPPRLKGKFPLQWPRPTP
jgi:hypothetical protein